VKLKFGITYTREEIEAAPIVCGADCWNPNHVLKFVARTHPDSQFRAICSGTGLWCDVVTDRAVRRAH
jgi:hypothetical protein